MRWRHLFILLIFVLSLRTSESAEAARNLEKAFNGQEPFFGVAVTRDVAEPDNYTPLPEEETYLIFCILQGLFGHPVSKEAFVANIKAIHQREKQKFLALLIHITSETRKEIATEIRGKTLTKEFLAGMKKRLKKFSFPDGSDQALYAIVEVILTTENLISLENAVQAEIDQPSVETLTRETADIIDKLILFTEKPFKKAIVSELFKSDIKNKIGIKVQNSLKEYDKFFLTRLRTHKSNLDSFFNDRERKLANSYQIAMRQLPISPFLRSSWSLVVFNEMFFSKTAPLDPLSFAILEQYLENFSILNPKAILDANTLNEAVYQQDEEQNELMLDHEFSRYAQIAGKISEFFYSLNFKGDTTQFNDHPFQHYFKALQEARNLPLHIFTNASYTYWNGKLLSIYQKTSYREEAENLLKRNYLYQIGDARDLPLTLNTSSLTLHPMYQHLDPKYPEIQRVLYKYLSTEICYDVEVGVRRAFRSYPDVPRIHVFPSNTLPVTADNIDNLPDNGSLVFHVDPEHTEVLAKTGVVQVDTSTPSTTPSDTKLKLSKKYKEKKFIRQTPFFSLQVLTDNNLFTFSVWNFLEIFSRMR